MTSRARSSSSCSGEDSDLGERLGHPEDHGHRGPELVREPGDELVAPGRALHERGLRGFELPDPAPLALERLGELLDHARGHLGGQERPSFGGPADGGQDLVAVGVLQDVARGPGDEHAADDLLILVARERDDPEVGEVRLEQARGLDAVHRWHPDVHQDHVGRERTHEPEGLRARARLAHHLQVAGLEEGQEGFAEAGIVVHDEDPDRPTVPDRAGKDRRFHVPQVSGEVRSGAIRRAWVSQGAGTDTMGRLNYLVRGAWRSGYARGFAPRMPSGSLGVRYPW